MGMQPKLRFKGFTDDWEKRRLGDVVNKVKSYSLSHDVECNESTGYKYIHYGDIHTGIADIINKKSVLPNIKPNQYDTLSVNDLIVADASEDYQGIASPAVIQALPDENLVAGLHTIALRPQATNATFLYHLLHTGNFKHFGYRTGTGLKVFGISWPNLSKFEFNLPSQKEQDEVVDLLRLLDNLIVVNQRKVDLLKKKKTGYLQKLFPKNGQNNPELRFKGFTDAWEKRKLNNVADIYDGTHQTPQYTKNGIPFISVENIKSLETNKYISKDDFLKNFKIKPEKSDILMTRIGDIGTTHVVPDNQDRAYYVSLALIKPHNQNSNFIAQYLESNSGQSELWKRTLHVAFPKKINKNEIGEVPLKVPVLQEQTKIGTFLNSVDRLITVNQRKVDLLKKEKKALLQKMFI
ncbi:restriction endonuclease subunit S [Weissella paramesenteroides]